MGTLFALVLAVATTSGDYQDLVLGVYESQQLCEAAATEQQVAGECWPVEAIFRNGEIPAEQVAKF
ncbi:YebW family protein [Atlantibacter subterranea]|uniref:DUF1482 family protein n=1 Tax=Atlantibacter subterraneus TaxID=255519 RepID=UPI0020C31465|nr:DUF1482 family protein [Atlantibacter subterranea]UTJ46627.1 YebW family protein [Atlantibacter subterranea]